MADIVTLTINPCDRCFDLRRAVAPFHKLRCSLARRDPGGGGINVARVVKRFGGDVWRCMQWAERWASCCGISLIRKKSPALPVPISEETREDFTVLEEASGRQYRFVLPRPRLSERNGAPTSIRLRLMRPKRQPNAFRGCQWKPSARRSERLLRPDSSNDEAGWRQDRSSTARAQP